MRHVFTLPINKTCLTDFMSLVSFESSGMQLVKKFVLIFELIIEILNWFFNLFSSQMYGTFLIQGLHMKLIPFYDEVSVPACWFSMFNIIIVLLFVPVVNRYVYPILDKLSPRSPYILRMSIGELLHVSLFVTDFRHNGLFSIKNSLKTL